MPRYQFKAARDSGELLEGTMVAVDPQAVAQLLRAQGQVPIEIVLHIPAASSKADSRFRIFTSESISSRDIEFFSLELATLLRAGLPLSQSLENLSALASKQPMIEMIQELHREIRGGAALSAALENCEAPFGRLYISMVRAGESSGSLDLAIERLADFQTRSREFRETVVASLIYPAMLLVLAVISVCIMVGFVVPQFTEMFAEAEAQLPMLTRIVAGSGTWFAQWWWVILGAIIASGFWVRAQWRDPEGRERLDERLLSAPLSRVLIPQIEIARFCRTLSTLLSSGVGLLRAMEISREVVTNTALRRCFEQAATRVRRGEGLAAPMRDIHQVPELATQLMQLGEDSGNLEVMLERIAGIYEHETQAHMKRLLTLLEPGIIMGIALLITVIILSVVQMILQSNDLPF